MGEIKKKKLFGHKLAMCGASVKKVDVWLTERYFCKSRRKLVAVYKTKEFKGVSANNMIVFENLAQLFWFND